MNIKNKLLTVVYIFLIFSISLVFTSCSEKTDNNADVEISSSVENLGQGDTQFLFTVVTADGKREVFNIFTNKKIVGEALKDHNLIEGEEGQFGLYVKTVNSVSYDYDKDGKYWAFYIDGEYAQTGVDKTEIKKGCSYMFKAE